MYMKKKNQENWSTIKMSLTSLYISITSFKIKKLYISNVNVGLCHCVSFICSMGQSNLKVRILRNIIFEMFGSCEM